MAVLEKDVGQLRVMVERHEAVIKHVDPSIDRIEGTLFQFFEIYRQIGRRFDHIDFRFEENSRRLDRIESALQTLSQDVDKRFTAVDQRFDTLESRFDTMQETLALVLEAVRPAAGGASVN